MAIGNIKGGPFKDWVTNQIEQREISLGKGIAQYNSETGTIVGKQDKDLLYQQSKTPWLRLASSVDIESSDGYGTLDRLLSLPGISQADIKGKQAARNFILQGGALSLDTDNNINLNSGINTTSNPLSGAYGWGGTTERGFVPMPGITGASVKYENNGALTRTEIKIKCYSRTQFALVDALYLRPGYTLLLEFGWSTYLQTNDDNRLLVEDEVKLESSDSFFTPALSMLLNPKRKSQSNQYRIIQKIKEERKRTSGNYEAVFGKIENFSWSMDPDGSYNCTIILRGPGAVIESLKMNINSTTDEQKINKDAVKVSLDDLNTEKELDPIPLIAMAQAGGTLPETLFAIYQNIRLQTGFKTPDSSGLLEDIYNFNLGSAKVGKGFTGRLNVLQGITDPGEDIMKDVVISDFPIVDNNGNYSRKSITIKNGAMGVVQTQTDDKHNFSPQVYITFGYLIALIQKLIVHKDKSTGCPFFIFDMDFQNLHEDKNYIRRIPGQFSINPLKYLIPYNNHRLNKVSQKYKTKLPYLLDWLTASNPKSLNAFIKKHNKNWAYNKGLGRLSQVYVNINNISKILQESNVILNDLQKSDKTVINFLDTVLKDMSITLGSINNVKAIVPNDGEKIKFVENTPQTFTGNPPVPYSNKMCRFNTFGFSSNNPSQRGGSIVRNLGIDSRIPTNFSNMITIGSQVNGNQLSGNSTSFSNYNTGIVDRIMPTKVIEDISEKSVDPLESQVLKLSSVIKKMQTSTPLGESRGGRAVGQDNGLMGDIYRDREWYGDDLIAFINLGTTYHQLLNGIYTQSPSIGGLGILNAPFFLPFNLSLDIDGISGIVMMQRFEIDQKILPPSYDKDSVEIIIRSVDHVITPDSWLTKLGTQSVPKFKIRKSDTSNLAEGTINATSKTTTAAFTGPFTDPDIFDEANTQRRMKLTKFWSNSSVTLGCLNIFQTDEITIDYSLPVVMKGIDGGLNALSQDTLFNDRYLVVNQPNAKYPNSLWVIGNSENNYDFDNLYKKGEGGARVNVLMFNKPNPNGIGPNIGVGLGFQMAAGNTQVDRYGLDRSGLGAFNRFLNGTFKGYKGSVDDGLVAMTKIYDTLGKVEQWYMDVETSNPTIESIDASPKDIILRKYKELSNGIEPPLQGKYNAFPVKEYTISLSTKAYVGQAIFAGRVLTDIQNSLTPPENINTIEYVNILDYTTFE